MHWRAVVATVAVAAVVASVGVWVVIDRSSNDFAVDCSVREAATFDEAALISSACGVDVEVTSERTPWQTSWTTAEGVSRLQVTAMPTRVQVEGEWTELSRSIVDPRLAGEGPSARGAGAPNSALSMSASELPDPDPMLEVEAPAFPIELNPGGDDGAGEPLGRIEKDGHDFAVWFPLDLPDAQIDGDRLVYDLGEGVRLFVTVNTNATGFVPVIELRDREALDYLMELLGHGSTPDALSTFTIPLPTQASSGLTYELQDNELRLVDASAEDQFRATAPSMWDSRAGNTRIDDFGQEETIDRSHWPSNGDQVAEIAMSLQGTSIVLDPDDDMLNSADTVWPVYIDPPLGARAPVEWIATRSGGFGNTLHNWGDISATMPGQGTGYCSSLPSCVELFTQRLTWEFGGLSTITAMTSADIVSASFNVNGVHSANCTAQTTWLRHSGTISSATSWSGQVWYGTDGSRTEAHSATCANRGFRAFVATNIIKAMADGTSTSIAMALRVNEGGITYWKRFRHDANLEIIYNRAPNVPDLMQLSNPSLVGCFQSGDPGLPPAVNSTTPTLQARFSDPDGQTVRPSFQVVTAGDAKDVRWSSLDGTAVSNNTSATAAVSSGLVNGRTYEWRARGLDTEPSGGRHGSWSDWCQFRVDTTPPSVPTVTPVRSAVQAVYEQDQTRGGVGVAGAFVFNRGSSTDVNRFEYSINNGPLNPVTADATGTAQVAFSPSAAIEYTLRVRSVDTAGNPSSYRAYRFFVGVPREDAVWILDEGTGTTAAQSMGTDVNPLRITGATWSEGPHGLFNSRQGDSSLLFDGINDAAVSDKTVLTTTGSYVVSAHVLLSANVPATATAVALSQDAVSTSAFRLQYVAPCPTGGNGCWAFTLASGTQGQSPVTVYSSAPAVKGEWTHLLASFDATGSTADPRSVQLWTCTIGTPTDPDPATPVGVKLTVLEAFTPMPSTGGLAVGRGLVAGVGADWWPGQIDNIRVFTGEIVDPPKIRRMCQGAEASDFTSGEVSLDPTVLVPGQ